MNAGWGLFGVGLGLVPVVGIVESVSTFGDYENDSESSSGAVWALPAIALLGGLTLFIVGYADEPDWPDDSCPK